MHRDWTKYPSRINIQLLSAPRQHFLGVIIFIMNNSSLSLNNTWPASWEVCMQVKKQQLEPGIEQWTGSKLGKEYIKDVYCLPPCLNYMQSTPWEMPGWMKHKLESRLPREISITYICYICYTCTVMAEIEEELKSLLIRVKEESEKVDLKLNIQKIIMSSGPISSWQIDGETRETLIKWQTLLLWAPKSLQMMTIDMKLKDACSIEEKLMTNLDSISKSRDITLLTKVLLVKAMVFPVVIYGCESRP